MANDSATAKAGASKTSEKGKSKDRSPNYPSYTLTDSIELVQKLYERERRTRVSAEVAAKALGWGGLSGASRGALAALRQYGLIESGRDGVRVSDEAIEILHQPADSKERAMAVRAAALNPPLFAELMKSHAHASDEALRAHLITKRKFSPDGAGRFVTSFRDALVLAGPDAEGYFESESDFDAPLPGEGTPKSGGDKRPPLADGRMADSGRESIDIPIPLVSGGQAVLRVPRSMTEADFGLLTSLLDSMLKGMKAALVVAPQSGGQ